MHDSSSDRPVLADPLAAVQAPSGDQMCSYAVDLWTHHPTILTDEVALKKVLREASEAGNAIVLAEASHVFPNGAVTIALVLSQSHLNIHTWPEHDLANVDLLTCGVLEGEVILDHVKRGLEASRTAVTRITRDVTMEPPA